MRALYDLQPRPLDSDYELAFRRAEGSKRALVVVFFDLLEEAAARPLVEAVPGPRRGATRSSWRARPTRRWPRSPTGEEDALRVIARDVAATCSRAQGRRAGPGGWRAGARGAAGEAARDRRRRLPAGEVARRPLKYTQRPEQHEQRRAERRLDLDRQVRPGGEALEEPAQHEPRDRARRDLDRRQRLAPQRRPAPQRARPDQRPARSAAPRSRRRRCTRSPAARARRSAAGTRRRCPRRSPARRSPPGSAR